MTLLGGRFEVLETIHRTDRGAVLRARDLDNGQVVALKVRPCPDDATQRELAGEASVLVRATPHPGLPVVLADLRLPAEGTYVIVMEWIDGKDLDQVLAERPDHRLPAWDVVEIVSQTADVLDHLHRQDPPVLHGDVKPSNLVLTVAGSIVLVDFDIASTGFFRKRAGSRFFAAPEVAVGDSVTKAIDVYGLAATAVKLLIGEPPGTGPLVLPDLDGNTETLATVLRAAMSVDPDRRPSSAGEFASRLRAGSVDRSRS